jgi:hypothetical protein
METKLFYNIEDTFSDFDGHGSWNDIARSKILGDGSVALHEPLSLGVDEVTALTSTALRHQTSGSVNTLSRERGKVNSHANSSKHTLSTYPDSKYELHERNYQNHDCRSRYRLSSAKKVSNFVYNEFFGTEQHTFDCAKINCSLI